MRKRPQPLHVAVEEEYQLVDRESGELRPDCSAVMQALPPGEEDAAEIQHELHLTQIEMASPICSTLEDVRRAVANARGRLIDAARSVGADLVAAGTHPLSHHQADDVTPKERYKTMSYRYQQIAKDLVIFGCHVHVDMPDRELGVQVMNRVIPWLPALQALTANSPFWGGKDTGYASYRREMWVQWPMAGPPIWFANEAEHNQCIRDLVQSDAISDATRIYWDVRLPERIPTIEFRVMDVLTRIDETVAIAGLIRSLVDRVSEDIIAGREVVRPRPELIRVALWQAARFGLTDHLLDPLGCRQVTAAEHISELLNYVRDSLDRYGEQRQVTSVVNRMLELGGGAARQRAFLQDHHWDRVVQRLAQETAIGTGREA